MVFNFGIFIPHDSPSLLDHNPVTKLIFENFPYADEAKKPFCEKWVNSDRPKKVTVHLSRVVTIVTNVQLYPSRFCSLAG